MKIIRFFSLVAVITMAIAVSSCGKKPVSANPGFKEIEIPFSTPEYRSDLENFREVGTAKSPDQATAKKIALLNARTMLAANVNSVVKAVSEQYTNQVTIGDKQELGIKFEENARNIVNQELSGVTIVGEKALMNNEGTIVYYVAIEMPRANLQKAIEDSISKDEKLALEFEKDRFSKIFNEEMEKFANNR